ncbi:hypothetical protein ACSSS7_003973 [Eimeria intestinalis]
MEPRADRSSVLLTYAKGCMSELNTITTSRSIGWKTIIFLASPVIHLLHVISAENRQPRCVAEKAPNVAWQVLIPVADFLCSVRLLMQGGSPAEAAWRCLKAASSSLSWLHRCGPHGCRPPTLWSCTPRRASLCADAQPRTKDGQGRERRDVFWPCSSSHRRASAARDDWRYAHLTSLPVLPAVLTAAACLAGNPMVCVSPVGSSCIAEGKTALNCNRQSLRFKMVKSSAYRRRSRASPTGQSQKAHVGPRRLSAEYVTPGVVLVKQRRYIAWGFESKRRNRHKKMYPGENVGVSKDSSLVALVHGRVKFTHDVARDVFLCNVLPEPREELLREDLWRYRTEHVASKEENRHVCHLRTKATRVFPKPLVNPPTKPLPRPKWLSAFDSWENPTLPDAPPLADDRGLQKWRAGGCFTIVSNPQRLLWLLEGALRRQQRAHMSLLQILVAVLLLMMLLSEASLNEETEQGGWLMTFPSALLTCKYCNESHQPSRPFPAVDFMPAPDVLLNWLWAKLLQGHHPLT